MDFEFLKQYFLWELAFFAMGVVLVFIGWAIWKLVKSQRAGSSAESRRPSTSRKWKTASWSMEM